jgi:hypothetical protein
MFGEMRHGFRLALGVVVIFASFLLFCLAAGWLMARGVLPNDSTPYVLLAAAGGMLGVLYLILYAAKRQLRKRFLARSPVSFQQWYDEHYKEHDVSPEIAERILSLAAKGIGGGVRSTQVLPTDRLHEDFMFRLCGTDIDNGVMLSHPLACLGDWLEEQTGEEYEASSNWRTIDDVIRDVSNPSSRARFNRKVKVKLN